MWSPDKQWWWNGERWIPASEAPEPPPSPPAQPPINAPQSPPGGPSQRPGRRPRWLLPAIVVLALLAMGICTVAIANSSTGSKKSAVAPKPSEPPRQIYDPNASSVPKFDLGRCDPQPCANDSYGWIVYVSDLGYDISTSNQFEKPEAGNVWVNMNLRFDNKTNRERHANPLEFVLLDGAGVKHSVTSLTTCPIWSAVNLTPGATLDKKCTAFQATAGKPQGLVLVWTPTFAGGDYRIKLT